MGEFEEEEGGGGVGGIWGGIEGEEDDDMEIGADGGASFAESKRKAKKVDRIKRLQVSATECCVGDDGVCYFSVGVGI